MQARSRPKRQADRRRCRSRGTAHVLAFQSVCRRRTKGFQPTRNPFVSPQRDEDPDAERRVIEHDEDAALLPYRASRFDPDEEIRAGIEPRNNHPHGDPQLARAAQSLEDPLGKRAQAFRDVERRLPQPPQICGGWWRTLRVGREAEHHLPWIVGRGWDREAIQRPGFVIRRAVEALRVRRTHAVVRRQALLDIGSGVASQERREHAARA